MVVSSGNTRFVGLDGLWQSFYSQQFYRDVLKHWRGFALRYLLLISLVFATFVAIGIYLKEGAILESADVETVFHSLPNLTMKDGVMTTQENKLEKILHPQSRTTAVIVVDPKDSVKKIEEVGAPVLLQSKTFAIQIPERQAIRMKYATLIKDGEISGENILSQLRALADLTILPIGVIAAILCFSLTFAKSMLIALLMKVFRAPHSYIDTTRILIVACTPNILLSGIGMLLNVRLGQWDLPVFNAIYILYIVFAFRACRAKDLQSELASGPSESSGKSASSESEE